VIGDKSPGVFVIPRLVPDSFEFRIDSENGENLVVENQDVFTLVFTNDEIRDDVLSRFGGIEPSGERIEGSDILLKVFPSRPWISPGGI
jgi:hypothetical protein